MSTNYAPFDGDGRTRAPMPTQVRPGTTPLPITNSAARGIIDRLLAAGASYHSEQGATLWVIETWAKHQGRKIEVELLPEATRGIGFDFIVRFAKPLTAAEHEQDPRVSMAAKQDARAFIHLRSAIRTARDAADKAERVLTMYANAPGAAVGAVLNALAWGHANASSSIETAMACVDDAHKVRALDAAEVAKASKA